MLMITHNWNQLRGAGHYGAVGFVTRPGAGVDPYARLFGSQPFAPAQAADTHPLHDPGHSRKLLERESQITAAFDAIEPVMREVAAMQWQEGFPGRALTLVRDRLGFDLPASCLRSTWSDPLNMRGLYAYSVYQTFHILAERAFDRGLADLAEGEPADELIRKWGFHAIDITPCADGRLSGVVDYILRVPPAVVVHRKSFAGAMFDIEESARNWSEIELRRHRESLPNSADKPTKYLKIGVYHTSGSDPAHEGCAAHGSDERRAARALARRLMEFGQAIENSYCCGASVATLLIGVDTDSDAIKVHVPGPGGEISLDRYVDNRDLFDATSGLSRDDAKQLIRSAVAQSAGVDENDPATEGMRWFCGYLLKNNMAQIEYVRAYHAGRYTDLGHTERFITVGDSFDEVQMRNLAYQAQMETVEEGAPDLDVGIRIFRKVNMPRGLPIPLIVHQRYDGRVPQSRERAIERALRIEMAIQDRYPDLVRDGWLYTYVTVRDSATGSRLEAVSGPGSQAGGRCACGCNKGGV